jgi:HSP20 family protein
MTQTWRWGPAGGAFGDIQEALSAMLDDWLGPVPAGEGRFPWTELRRTEEGYEAWIAVPGVSREAVDLSVEGRTLVLEGERRQPDLPEGWEPVRRERPAGRFRRVIELPEGVDNTGIAAKLENGVLRVTLPRAEAERPREIRIELDQNEEGV